MHFTCKWILVSSVFKMIIQCPTFVIIEEMKNIQETIGSIPFDLLSFNEPRYQARYLSIYRDSWILNFKIYFRPLMTRLFQGFIHQVSRAYKSYLLQLSSYKQGHVLRYMLYRSCCDFLCTLGLCTKLLLDLQVLIEELYILQQQSSCYTIRQLQCGIRPPHL